MQLNDKLVNKIVDAVVQRLSENETANDMPVYQPGPQNLASERESLCAPALLCTVRGECSASLAKDERDVGKRLDVVDVGRLTEQSLVSGERWSRPRHAAPTLD